MKNNSNSNTLYTEDIDDRTSMDPINPPATAHTNYSSSSISLDTVGQDPNPKLTHQNTTKTETEAPPTRMERFKTTMKMLLPTFEMLFFDVGLPLAIYYILKIWLSVLIALLLSGIPPLLRVLYLFWKRGKVDILGCIFVISFVISGVLSIISGDARLALLRDSTTTAIISFMFFVTLIPIRTKWFTVRPLIYLISQQMMAEAPPITWTDIEGEEHSQDLMEWIWEHCHIFRKYCYILCAIWSFVLMAEFVAKVIMIQSSLTIDQILLYGNIMVIVVIVTMTVGTTIASRFIRKRTVAILNEWKKENDFTAKFAADKTSV